MVQINDTNKIFGLVLLTKAYCLLYNAYKCGMLLNKILLHQLCIIFYAVWSLASQINNPFNLIHLTKT